MIDIILIIACGECWWSARYSREQNSCPQLIEYFPQNSGIIRLDADGADDKRLFGMKFENYRISGVILDW